MKKYKNWLIILAVIVIAFIVGVRYNSTQPKQIEPIKNNQSVKKEEEMINLGKNSKQQNPKMRINEQKDIEMWMVLPKIETTENGYELQQEEMPVIVSKDEFIFCRAEGKSKTECEQKIKELIQKAIDDYKKRTEQQWQELQKEQSQEQYQQELNQLDLDEVLKKIK